MRILIVALGAFAACGSSCTARGAREGAARGAGAGAAGGAMAGAEKATRESLEILRDVREEYGLPRECRG